LGTHLFVKVTLPGDR